LSLLMGGALGLIVVSALAILFGWANANQALIYVSIASSAGVAVCLALAYSRSREPGPRDVRSSEGRRRPGRS